LIRKRGGRIECLFFCGGKKKKKRGEIRIRKTRGFGGGSHHIGGKEKGEREGGGNHVPNKQGKGVKPEKGERSILSRGGGRKETALAAGQVKDRKGEEGVRAFGKKESSDRETGEREKKEKGLPEEEGGVEKQGLSLSSCGREGKKENSFSSGKREKSINSHKKKRRRKASRKSNPFDNEGEKGKRRRRSIY